MNLHTSSIRASIALSSAVACALSLAACGSESAAGDVDAFCEELRRSESEESVDLSDDPAAGMAELERFRDLAPSELRDDIDVIIDVFTEVQALEATGDDEENFGAIFELAFDPKVIAATENLEAFGVEECGLEPSSTEDDGFADDGVSDDGFSFELDEEQAGDRAVVDDTDQDSADDAPPVDGLVTEPADVPDPLFDPIFDDDALDPSELSIDGVKYYLDLNHTDAPWRTRLGSWLVVGSGNAELAVGGLDITAVEASQVCGALIDYLRSLGADGIVAVSTYGQNANGSFGDEQEVLRTTVTDGC